MGWLDVVTQAGIGDAPLQVDAEAVDHVARPAAAVALQFERVLGGKHTAVAQALDVELEVTFLAEQAEAVLHFPGNLEGRVGGGLSCGPMPTRCQKCARDRSDDKQTKAKPDHAARLTLQLGRK